MDYEITGGSLKLELISYNGAVEGTTHYNPSLTSGDAVRISYTFITDSDADNLEINIRAEIAADVGIVSHLKLEQGAIATPYIHPDRDRTTIRTEATNATPDPIISAKRNIHIITAIGAPFELQEPTGDIRDGDSLVFRILDDSTGRALTYTAKYRGICAALPDTTVADKTMYLGFLYNSADDKYDMVALAEEA